MTFSVQLLEKRDLIQVFCQYDEPQRISSRRLLADGAEAVLNQCTKDGEVAGDFEVPGGWRVSVKAEDSDC
jgi:hypothetical protein